jgi:hypothetical protein
MLFNTKPAAEIVAGFFVAEVWQAIMPGKHAVYLNQFV